MKPLLADKSSNTLRGNYNKLMLFCCIFSYSGNMAAVDKLYRTASSDNIAENTKQLNKYT